MIKLIINSHIKYGKAREVLFESLNKTSFTRYNDIVVVYSGSDKNTEPYLSDKNYTIVESTKNNFDYNAYNILYEYQDHKLISSDFYLYLHDTITFHTKFDKFYCDLLKLVNNIPLDNIFISNSFHSNICLFGKDIINQYKTNFELPLSKEEAIYLELHNSYSKNNKTIYNISTYGKKNVISNRYEISYPELSPDGIDIYNTGYPRKGFFYPLFGIYKWILWSKNGDFTEEKVLPNNLWW